MSPIGDRWSWELYSANGYPIATYPGTYISRSACLRAMKRIAELINNENLGLAVWCEVVPCRINLS